MMISEKMNSVEQVYSAFPRVMIMHAASKNGTIEKGNHGLVGRIRHATEKGTTRITSSFSILFSTVNLESQIYFPVGIIVKTATIVEHYDHDVGVMDYSRIPDRMEKGNSIQNVVEHSTDIYNEIILQNVDPFALYFYRDRRGSGETQDNVRAASKELELPVYELTEKGLFFCVWDDKRGYIVAKEQPLTHDLMK